MCLEIPQIPFRYCYFQLVVLRGHTSWFQSCLFIEPCTWLLCERLFLGKHHTHTHIGSPEKGTYDNSKYWLHQWPTWWIRVFVGVANRVWERGYFHKQGWLKGHCMTQKKKNPLPLMQRSQENCIPMALFQGAKAPRISLSSPGSSPKQLFASFIKLGGDLKESFLSAFSDTWPVVYLFRLRSLPPTEHVSIPRKLP